MLGKNKIVKVDDSMKSNVIKYGLVFTGGLVVGFGIKALLDSNVLDEVKNRTPANVYDEDEEEEKEKVFKKVTID